MNGKRFKPHHLSIIVGVAFAVVTVASGIAGAALAFHDDSEESRLVFGNIPDALQVAFYTVIPILT